MIKRRWTALLMAAVLGLGFDAAPVLAGETENIPAETSVSDGCFSVGVNGLTGEFSPFFSRSGSDQKAAALTQENLLVIDRSGGVICNGIEGETVSFGETSKMLSSVYICRSAAGYRFRARRSPLETAS